jgi:hypothetical protein
MYRRNLLKWAGLGASGVLSAAYGLEISESAAQTTLNSLWVHGTAFQAEEPEALASTRRWGWGTSFKGTSGVATWFHVSIPTPVVHENEHPRLGRFSLLYKLEGAVIVNIHIYDGARKIKTIDNLTLRGDLSRRVVPDVNTWEFDPPVAISGGLGVSVNVQFAAGTGGPYGAANLEALFAGAGADFVTSKIIVRPPSNLNLNRP